MREHTSGKLPNHLRRAAMAIVASGIVVVPTVQATPFNKIVLVPPTELPELARQPGEAMFLHDADDGRTILYVEQNLGAQLAVFDVTDPSHVKSDGSVKLGAPGPFDFVSPLGGQKELVRFRQDQGEAVLDLRRARLPNLKELQRRDWQGAISLLGNDGFTVSAHAVASPKAADPQPIRDYQVFDTSGQRDLNPVLDVKQVREELTKQDTGTTFILTEGGLYLIRRPIEESEKRRREQEWFFQHAGAGG
jgi:hypothetical protein